MIARRLWRPSPPSCDTTQRVRPLTRLLTVLALLSGAAGCKAPPEPLRIEGNVVRIENHTKTTWTGVEIWVNDHYRAMKSTIVPGERVDVPLDVFIAGFGQRFDPRRQTVKGIEVTGKQGDKPLKLVWGEGRKTF